MRTAALDLNMNLKSYQQCRNLCQVLNSFLFLSSCDKTQFYHLSISGIACLWYGVLKDDFTMIVVNSTGVVFHVFYVTTYLFCAKDRVRKLDEGGQS